MITTQTEFRAALLDPTRAAPAGVRNPGGAQATKRFDVYRNNVAAGLTDALETAFPVVDKLVGNEFFRAMAGLYLRAHPPHNPLLMYYGADMPAFLTAFEPAQTVPYLPDVARVELALRHSYHAADATPIAPDSLAALAPDTLPHVTFGFAPSVFVIPSAYPLHSIWWANTHGGDIAKTAQPVLITRAGFDLGPLLGLLLSRNALISLKT